jgi:hypothetical protein
MYTTAPAHAYAFPRHHASQPGNGRAHRATFTAQLHICRKRRPVVARVFALRRGGALQLAQPRHVMPAQILHNGRKILVRFSDVCYIFARAAQVVALRDAVRDGREVEDGLVRENGYVGELVRRTGVISEATYEGDPTDWLEFAGGLVTGLGPQLAAFGMEYNAPLLDPATGCLARAAALGVTALYAWVNVPAVNNTAAWDAFGWWLAAPAATPHFLPA